MADQEVNVEESGAYKSLGGFGKTISTIGKFLMVFGAILLVFGFLSGVIEGGEVGYYVMIGCIPVIAIGFFVVIAGQLISCFVAVARNTETTNNILTRHTELLEILIKKFDNKDD